MGWLNALRRPRAEDPRAALVDPIEQALRVLGWVEGVVGPPRAVDSPFGIDETALVDPIEQALRVLGWVEGVVGPPRAVDSPFGI
ncbi:hypothetical protein C7E12_12425, partial [Stenotrophomonas maltophilia]